LAITKVSNKAKMIRTKLYDLEERRFEFAKSVRVFVQKLLRNIEVKIVLHFAY
jgi:hypothetical protein